MPRFGVAGYPPAFAKSKFGRDRMQICPWLKSLGIEALELQMTYGPRTSPETCGVYRTTACDCGITLTVHGSYFIVFTSEDRKKLERSRETLKRTFDLCSLLDAKTIVLHPGPLYGSKDAGRALGRFIENLGVALGEIGKTDIGLYVETAGKLGQLGSVDEILEISGKLPGVFPCIDFGHVHARTLGSLKNRESVLALFDKLGHGGWFSNSRRIHFHYTPIHFGSKGEIGHRSIMDRYPTSNQAEFVLDDSANEPGGFYSPRYEHVAEGLARWDVDCIVISETNESQEQGAMALRDEYLRLKR